MVVERSDSEDLLSIPELLRGDLDDHRYDLKEVDSRYDEQDDERVREHGDDSEIRSEREGSHIPHVEFRRFDIEPEEGDERSDDDHAECTEDEHLMIEGDDRVDRIIEEQQSSGKSIETVGDIHRIRHGDDDEDEDGDIEETEIQISEEWHIEAGMSELEVEPIGSERSEQDEPEHLEFRADPLRPSDSADVHIIIHKSQQSDGREREERKIGLAPIPEGILDLISGVGQPEKAEEIVPVSQEEDRKDDEESDNSKDHSASHRGGSCLFGVELREFGSLSDERIIPYLLPELVSIEESDVERSHRKRDDERKHQVGEEELDISHRIRGD